MSKHIYIFGSICRGEYTAGSDIDLLVVTDAGSAMYERERFSIYSYERLQTMWEDGNPFAWHLKQEARLVFSSDGRDWIQEQGLPATYERAKIDCAKFRDLFLRSTQEIEHQSQSVVFELSSIFLSIRNFATCFTIGKGAPCFSRESPYASNTRFPMDKATFQVLVAARILSTRGVGSPPSAEDIAKVMAEVPAISNWMDRLMAEVSDE